jgi:hypothetical protein
MNPLPIFATDAVVLGPVRHERHYQLRQPTNPSSDPRATPLSPASAGPLWGPRRQDRHPASLDDVRQMPIA